MWLWVWHCDMCICNLGTWAGSIHVRGAPAPIMLTSPISIAVWCLRGAAGRVLMYLIIDSTPSYERWMNLQYILKFLKYIICIDYSVENKIIFFLNSLFLNSCSLKYYYTASEEPQLRLRAVLPTSLYWFTMSILHSSVVHLTYRSSDHVPSLREALLDARRDTVTHRATTPCTVLWSAWV